MGIDWNGIFNPNENGVGDFFKNDVKNALDPKKNGFSNFYNNTLAPLAKNLYATFIEGPMKFIQGLYKAATSLLSGNGLYIIIGAVVIGGIVYYQSTNGKLK